nr:ATP synthase F0 subunit 8 [Eliomys quercinus]UNH57989.1 ATP synthase F0 subunit 8 [Eliomys quercinus]UNH58002.1 ATP synthase F0 subunit 8 [Eliomys quercinus]UNH58015.1 ATP synthase F0 subunit 8 [Eliomys quercinus]
MPQLDTSTWFITIMSTMMALYLIIQLKVSTHLHQPNPTPKDFKSLKHKTPWDTKWTKIYLPHS